jgi:transposase
MSRADSKGSYQALASVWTNGIMGCGKMWLKATLGRRRHLIFRRMPRGRAKNLQFFTASTKARKRKTCTAEQLPNSESAKKKGWRWKRTRHSQKRKQDPVKRKDAMGQLCKLELMMREGYIDLEYLDESGFCAWSEVSYSYSKKREQKRLEQPKKKAKRLNIIGVLKKDESFEYGLIKGKFDSKVYIEFMDILAKRADQKFKETGRITVLVQDNSSVHKSKLSQAQWGKWHRMGLWLFFLPPYCSELNAIEVEWHQIKAHEICGRMFADEQELSQCVTNAVESRNQKKGMRVEKFSLNP